MRIIFPGSAVVTGCVLVFAGMTLSAADWPSFRGAGRDGKTQETGLLKQWPDGGPPLAWKNTGIGKGYSGVSVVGGRIYTSGDQPESSYVYALNLKDGKQVWAAKLGKPGAMGYGNFAGPRATPTIDGDSIFTVDQWGELVCMQKADGKEKWRKSYTQDFGAKLPEWGFAEAPLVDGDKVVITPGGQQGAVVALNRDTGAVVWRSKEFTDDAHYSSLIQEEIGGVKQYIQLTERSVVGVSAKDGKMLWKAPRRGATAVIPTPVSQDDHVYVTSGYGIGCHLFKISKSGDSFNAEQVYANKVMVNHHGGVILLDGNVYGFSDGKGWSCQDFMSGEAKWQEKGTLGKGAISYADGRFYLRQEDKGTMVLIEASSEAWKEVGRFEQPERRREKAWPHPVIAYGKMFLRDQDLLLAYDIKAK